jgi:hypothetical protein
MGADRIGQFQLMLVSSLRRKQLERTGGGADGYVGDLQIARGVFQVGMAEQDLNGAQIDIGCEQVSVEGVPPMPHAA